MKDCIVKRRRAVTQVDNKGFSLIELIIVIAIMAVLVAVIAPQLASYLGTSKKRSDETNANEIEKVITYIVQEALTDEEFENVSDNILDYNSRIIRLDKMIADVDSTGAFELKVKEQLKMNEFKCKRDGFNYYIQVFVDDAKVVYKVDCRSVKEDDDEISEWPA